MQEFNLTMALNLGGRVQERERVNKLLRLRHGFYMGKDRPMIASPIVFVSTVLLYDHRTVRVVFY